MRLRDGDRSDNKKRQTEWIQEVKQSKMAADQSLLSGISSEVNTDVGGRKKATIRHLGTEPWTDEFGQLSQSALHPCHIAGREHNTCRLIFMTT